VSSQLGTYSALALYEICARYRDNPSGVTSRKPPDWWIDALSSTAVSAEKKRREWRKFKVEKVNDAIAEINSETDLNIELIEHKSGRSVSEVQFNVRRKKNQSSSNELTSINLELVGRAGRLGVSEARAEALIRNYGAAVFSTKLEELRVRLFDKSKSPIENQFAYLKVILKNSELGTSSEVKAQAIEPVTARLIEAKKENVTAAVNPPEEGRVVRQITKEMNELPVAELRIWIDQACAELKAAGMYSAIVQKRAQEDKIGTGILGGKVVSLYAQATYGPNWRTIDFAVPLEDGSV
jgi:hypothetical protein